jgi:hypothetical protein
MDFIGVFLYKAPSLIIKGEKIVDNSPITSLHFSFHLSIVHILVTFIVRSLIVLMIDVGSLITMLIGLVSTSEQWD